MSLGRAGVVVTIANAVINLLAYLVPLLGARYLTAGDLGALATAMALYAIATVPGVGLQTAIAVSVARGDAPANLGWVSAATAGLCAGALLLATPLLVTALDLPLAVPFLLAATTVPIVLGCRSLGELQGASRFSGLAVAMAVLALARYGGVVIGLVAGLGLVGSLTLGLVIAWLLLPALSFMIKASFKSFLLLEGRPDHGKGRLSERAVFTAATATLAMLAASYADLILARYVLSAADSGAYAVGAVLTRGAIWAPQVVTVVALPRLAQGHRRTLAIGMAVLSGVGLVLVAVTALLSDLAVTLAGGPDYQHISGYALWFAALGAAYSVIFFLLNAQIAQSARWPSAPLWCAVAALGVAVVLLPAPTIGSVLACALAAALAAALAMTILTARHGRLPAPPAALAASLAEKPS
ncbi:polysaccharide biosynthesis protein [Actinomycetes bacterium KLBMP 9797]